MPVCVQKQYVKHWTKWTKFKNSKKVQSSVIFSSFTFWKTHRTKPSLSFAVAQWLLVIFTAESSIWKSTDWTQGTFDWVVGQKCLKQKAVILSLPQDSKTIPQPSSTAPPLSQLPAASQREFRAHYFSWLPPRQMPPFEYCENSIRPCKERRGNKKWIELPAATSDLDLLWITGISWQAAAI